MKRAVVIGAGLGGLAAAATLAHAGWKVDVLEQQSAIGGKLQRITSGGYVFDRGPSMITLKPVFERLFQSVGKCMDSYMAFHRLDVVTRNVFVDGTVVDTSADAAAMESQIAAYSPNDALRYRTFMAESAQLYELAERYFFDRLLVSWRDKLDVGLARGLLRVRPLTSYARLLRRYFSHPHTLALFGRYATYVGSDPVRAPAIFAMLPHVEIGLGGYAVEGGTYRIAQSFGRLAEDCGAAVHTSVRATGIISRDGRVIGVDTEGGAFEADVVIAGADVLSVNRELLDSAVQPAMSARQIDSYEPSLSGFSMMLGIGKRFEGLLHHTVFFPERYGEEFDAIFRHRQAPSDPAIYVCFSGYSEAGLAPEGGSNLFVLVNAPYLSEAWNWEEQREEYARHLLGKLEERGLAGIANEADVVQSYAPDQLYRDTSAFRGAIYGISSNSARQTFNRPSNRGRLDGLWFAGGTTHPGGGTPMVTLSGMLTAERIKRLHG